MNIMRYVDALKYPNYAAAIWLNADGQGITCLKGIGALKNLKYLSLQYNWTNDITPIFDLNCLVSLDIRNTGCTSLKGIEALEDLEFLLCSTAKINIFSAIEKLNKIANNKYLKKIEKYQSNILKLSE